MRERSLSDPELAQSTWPLLPHRTTWVLAPPCTIAQYLYDCLLD